MKPGDICVVVGNYNFETEEVEIIHLYNETWDYNVGDIVEVIEIENRDSAFKVKCQYDPWYSYMHFHPDELEVIDHVVPE
jgi:hypothetical protein